MKTFTFIADRLKDRDSVETIAVSLDHETEENARITLRRMGYINPVLIRHIKINN